MSSRRVVYRQYLGKGFLLIECCMYIAICSILTATLMHWISQAILESGQHTTIVQKKLDNALLYDVLMRDIQTASCDTASWRIEPTYIVWKKNNTTSIGWYKDESRLVRKEGGYDRSRNTWSKHKANTLAHVDLFHCVARQKDGVIEGIEVTLGNNDIQKSTRYMRIRNSRSYEKYS